MDGAAGRTVRASVHRTSLRIQRVQSADDQTARHHAIGSGRLETHRTRLDILARDFLPRRARPRCSAAGSKKAARAARCSPPALCWAGGFFISAFGVYIHNLWLIYLGYGVLGGMRARHRLHLAGLDADQMVPRPSRHGDGHGHHGLRRRRFHRLSALGVADEQVQHATHIGVVETFIVMGASISLHDGRLRSSSACRRRAGSRQGYVARRSNEADHQERRLSSMTR